MRAARRRQLSGDILRAVMAPVQDREALCALPLLSDLPRTALDALCDAVGFREHPSGAVLLSVDATDHDLLFLLSGQVRVWVAGRGVAELGPGSLLGELGFFERYPSRSADVVVSSPVCRVAVLTRASYAGLPTAVTAALEQRILSSLSDRLAATQARIEPLLRARRPTAQLRRWLFGRGGD